VHTIEPDVVHVLKRNAILLLIIALLSSLAGANVCFITVSGWNGFFDVDTHKPLFLFDASEHSVNLPFHYQDNQYYCGPAALQIVFDFYGENISQLEIADVARTVPNVTYDDELRRASHFSNTSTSMGTEVQGNITGYARRTFGYAAFEKAGLTIDDLKDLISQDYPVILLMRWIPGETYGHFRVAVGYNQTHIFLHDPWNNIEWGGDYGGPNLAMNYTFLLNMWDYSGHWALLASPWKITLDLPKVAYAGERLNVTANITYPCPTPFSTYDYPASSCKATINLSQRLGLTIGENATQDLGDIQAGNVTKISWTVEVEKVGNYSLIVEVEGNINGFVGAKPDAGPTYEYQDRIGGYIASVGTALEDKNPPNVCVPTQEPLHDSVMTNHNVTVSVNITDSESGVKNATLHCNINNSPTWTSIPMRYNSTSSLYHATIPRQPEGTWVKYKIIACDNAGNMAVEDNAEQYYVYVVIQEFPSLLILLLFMTATLLALMIYKRKHTV